MSNCFSCGKSFKGDTNELLAYLKQDYINNGIERYFYRLDTNGSVYTCRKSSFSSIFKDKIQPNFINGAEYAHIREYNNVQK